MEQIFKDFAEAISPALAQLVVALVGALVAYATAYVREKWNNEKANLSQTQQYLLELAAQNAVKSAAQIYGEAKERNEEKFNYAFETVNSTMKQWGFVIDSAVVMAQIEAMVGYHKYNKSKG